MNSADFHIKNCRTYFSKTFVYSLLLFDFLTISQVYIFTERNLFYFEKEKFNGKRFCAFELLAQILQFMQNAEDKAVMLLVMVKF